jgi:glyoxylase-like metal-dependent hydrolase (beta-lactamase superfamily II)
MPSLVAGMDYVDLHFLGRPGIIATAVLQGPSGVALIDPGPSTTLATLTKSLAARGVRIDDVRHILLTHIHLDHAGATGSLVRLNPAIEVLVHEKGAPHMIDPRRLIESATRLYREDMERLWGEFVPVPADRVRSLAGGETVAVAGRELRVAWTPGHAIHHVCYFDPSARVAFVGDTGGIRLIGSEFVMPPTPPPDIDLEGWRASADRILEWDPDTLFLTHFGPFNGARVQFQQLFDRMAEWSRTVRRLLADPALDDVARQQAFEEEGFNELRRVVGPQTAEHYGYAGRLDYSWQGLARYWKKKHPSPAAG